MKTSPASGYEVIESFHDALANRQRGGGGDYMPFTPTFRTTISLAITLTAAHPAIASPIRLSHQGRLLDETGAPLEGEHELTARLVTEAGDLLWSDSVPTVFQHGYYHLVLGAHAPLDDELFRGGSPLFELAVDGGPPIPVEGPLTHVPYAAVAEWAREAHSVRGGVVDASEVRVNGQTVLQAGATTTLGRVRADQGLQLGAGATAACEAGTRGLLRYTSAGALEVCSLGGWVEVGASEPGTCSIVGECPGGEEPSRVWFDNLTLASQEAVDHLCSRYERVLGALLLTGELWSPVRVEPVELPCLLGRVGSVDTKNSPGLVAPNLTGTLFAAELAGQLQLDALNRVGTDLYLRNVPATTALPSLQTVGGRLAWSWAEGVDTSLILPDAIPVLESVGGTFGLSDSGPRVLAPNLTSVGGDYIAFNTEAPNLREVGGTLILSQPQPTFPALVTVGGLRIHNFYSTDVRIDPPFSLDSLASLRRIDGNLTISCVRGWELPELNAFVDRIGRDNIGGTITLRPSSDSRCH